METYQYLKIIAVLNKIFLVGNLLKIFLNAEAAAHASKHYGFYCTDPYCRHNVYPHYSSSIYNLPWKQKLRKYSYLYTPSKVILTGEYFAFSPIAQSY
jgi:hypothetical protein